MQTVRFDNPTRAFALAAILLATALSVAQPIFANPGLIPTSCAATAYVDFAGFPDEASHESGLAAWQGNGWTRGSRCLQLICSGAYLEAEVLIPFGTTVAQLSLVHRSAIAPGCTGGGLAPVTISVNGTVLASGFAPPAKGADGFSIDRWEIASRLTPGRNRIRITAGALCSLYEVQRVELRTTAETTGALTAYQMTHAIAQDRPTDDVTTFASDDAQAVCWAQVTPEARGRRIEFRFYDPSGSLYFSTSRIADRYNWGYINVAGWRAASLRGQWRVDIFVAGEFQLSIRFRIGSAWNGRAPRVTGVNFPSVIRANGERTAGWVSFHDPDRDISWVTFEAVDGFFSNFEFDPNVGGQTDGWFDFYVYTWLSQRITLKVTLYDRQGNRSQPHYFDFNAE